jgi:hypothetical protein
MDVVHVQDPEAELDLMPIMMDHERVLSAIPD